MITCWVGPLTALSSASPNSSFSLSPTPPPTHAPSTHTQVPTIAPCAENSALTDLFLATGARQWANSTGWNSGNCCAWHGVECDARLRVVGLDLSNNCLRGELPESLGSLSHLERLYMNHNSLVGPLPKSIGKLARLQTLHMFANNLNGELPSSVGNLSRLEDLMLGANDLRGPLPNSISSMTSLWRLDLSENEINGTIPDSIGSLTNLAYLFLYSNRLSGNLPPTLTSLVNARILGLDGNRLSGPISQEIGQLGNLSTLMLYSNRLTGKIPSSIYQLKHLELLDLSRNRLTGKIPRLGPSFTSLRLFSNDLTGPIPPSLASMRLLRELRLDSNRLDGVLPNLRNLSDLQLFNVKNNRLTGCLLDQMDRLPQSLRYLEASDNMFTGANCSPAAVSFPLVHFFNVSHNELLGQSLEAIQLGSPAFLDLRGTSLKCPLPEFQDDVTVSLSTPMPCDLDLSFVYVELYILAVLVLVALVAYAILSRYPRISVETLKKLRCYVQSGVRMVTLISTLGFLSSALHGLHPDDAASCGPVNTRVIFDSFMTHFTCNGRNKPLPDDNMTFQNYMAALTTDTDGCAALSSDDPLVRSSVKAFSLLCDEISGCKAVTVTPNSWPSCVKGEDPPLPLFRDRAIVEWLVIALIVVVIGRELLRVLLLLSARFLQRPLFLKHFLYLSPFMPFICFQSPLLEEFVVKHRASPIDYLWEFVHGALLVSLPTLGLTLYFYMVLFHTSLNAFSTAILPLSALTSLSILLKAAVACCCSRSVRIPGDPLLQEGKACRTLSLND